MAYRATLDLSGMRSGFNSIVSEGKRAASDMSSGFSGAFGKLEGMAVSTGKAIGAALVAGVMIFATALAGVGALLGKSAMDWEKQIGGVFKTTNLDKGTAAANEMNDSLLELYSTMKGVNKGDITTVAGGLGSLGIANDQIKATTKSVLQASGAFGISSETATDELGVIAQLWAKQTASVGGTAAMFDKAGSAVNELGNKFASKEPNLLAFLSTAGGIAGTFKQALEPTAAFGSLLETVGVKGTDAGTALRSMTLEGLMAGSQQKFDKKTGQWTSGGLGYQYAAQVMGIGDKEMKERLSKDLYGTIIDISTAVSQLPLTEFEKTEKMKKIFGSYGFEAAAKVAGLKQNFQEMNDVAMQGFADGTSMTKEYERQTNNLWDSLGGLWNAIDAGGIKVFSDALGPVGEKVNQLADWVRAATPSVVEFVKALTAGDWGKVGTMLQAGMQSAFATLSSWGSSAWDWLVSAASKINWSSVGQSIQTGLQSALTAGMTGLENAGSWIWAQIGPSIESLSPKITAALATIGTGLGLTAIAAGFMGLVPLVGTAMAMITASTKAGFIASKLAALSELATMVGQVAVKYALMAGTATGQLVKMTATVAGGFLMQKAIAISHLVAMVPLVGAQYAMMAQGAVYNLGVMMSTSATKWGGMAAYAIMHTATMAGGVLTGYATMATGALASVATMVTGTISGIISIGAAIAAPVAIVVAGLAAIGYALDPSKFTVFNSTAVAAFNGIKDVVTDCWNAIQAGDWNAVGERLKQAFGDAMAFIKGLNWNGLGSELMTAVGDGAKAIVQSAMDIGGWIHDKITNWIAAGGPRTLGENIADAIGGAISSLLGSGEGKFDFWAAIKTALGTVADWLGMGYEIIKGIGEGILEKIKDYLTPAQNQFVDFVASVGNMFIGLGTTIASGIGAGIDAAGSKAAELVTWMGRNIPGFAGAYNGVTGSTSPSSTSQPAFPEPTEVKTAEQLKMEGLADKMIGSSRTDRYGLITNPDTGEQYYKALTYKIQTTEPQWSTPDVYGYSHYTDSDGNTHMRQEGVSGELIRNAKNPDQMTRTNDAGETTYSGNTSPITPVIGVDKEFLVEWKPVSDDLTNSVTSMKDAWSQETESWKWKVEQSKTQDSAAEEQIAAAKEAAAAQTELSRANGDISNRLEQFNSQFAGTTSALSDAYTGLQGVTASAQGAATANQAASSAITASAGSVDAASTALTLGAGAVRIGLDESGRQIAVIGSVAQRQSEAAGGKWVSDSAQAGTQFKADGAATGASLKADGAAFGSVLKLDGSSVGASWKSDGSTMGSLLKSDGSAMGATLKVDGATTGSSLITAGEKFSGWVDKAGASLAGVADSVLSTLNTYANNVAGFLAKEKANNGSIPVGSGTGHSTLSNSLSGNSPASNGANPSSSVPSNSILANRDAWNAIYDNTGTCVAFVEPDRSLRFTPSESALTSNVLNTDAWNAVYDNTGTCVAFVEPDPSLKFTPSVRTLEDAALNQAYPQVVDESLTKGWLTDEGTSRYKEDLTGDWLDESASSVKEFGGAIDVLTDGIYQTQDNWDTFPSTVVNELNQKLTIKSVGTDLKMSDSLSSWGGQPNAKSGTTIEGRDPNAAQWTDCVTGACKLQTETTKQNTSDWLDTGEKFSDTIDGNWLDGGEISINSATIKSSGNENWLSCDNIQIGQVDQMATESIKNTEAFRSVQDTVGQGSQPNWWTEAYKTMVGGAQKTAEIDTDSAKQNADYVQTSLTDGADYSLDRTTSGSDYSYARQMSGTDIQYNGMVSGSQLIVGAGESVKASGQISGAAISASGTGFAANVSASGTGLVTNFGIINTGITGTWKGIDDSSRANWAGINLNSLTTGKTSSDYFGKIVPESADYVSTAFVSAGNFISGGNAEYVPGTGEGGAYIKAATEFKGSGLIPGNSFGGSPGPGSALIPGGASRVGANPSKDNSDAENKRMNAAANKAAGTTGKQYYATGGIVDHATLGVFGEAGREAFVPLDDKAAGRKILAQILPEFGVPAFATGGVVGSSSRGQQTLISVSFTDFIDSVVYGSTQIVKGLKEGTQIWKTGIDNSVTTLNECWNTLKNVIGSINVSGSTTPSTTPGTTPSTTPETKPTTEKQWKELAELPGSTPPRYTGFIDPSTRLQLGVAFTKDSARHFGLLTPAEAKAAGLVPMATGGIVDHAAIGVFGEAGREALVPLDNKAAGKKILAQILPEFGVHAFASGGIVGSSSRGQQTLISVSFADFIDSVVYGSTQVEKNMEEAGARWKNDTIEAGTHWKTSISESATTLNSCWAELKSVVGSIKTTPDTTTKPGTTTSPGSTTPGTTTKQWKELVEVRLSDGSLRYSGFIDPSTRLQLTAAFSTGTAKTLGLLTPSEARTLGITPMALGGYVPYRPGGMPATIAESGDEYVVPERGALVLRGGSSKPVISVTLHYSQTIYADGLDRNEVQALLKADHESLLEEIEDKITGAY